MYDKNNIFYKIVKGEVKSEIIDQNNSAIAIYDITPKAKIHALVISKGEYTSYQDFIKRANKDEVYDFFKFIDKIAEKLGIGTTGYRIVSNIGHDSCQEIAHFHIHVLGGQSLGCEILGVSKKD